MFSVNSLLWELHESCRNNKYISILKLKSTIACISVTKRVTIPCNLWWNNRGEGSCKKDRGEEIEAHVWCIFSLCLSFRINFKRSRFGSSLHFQRCWLFHTQTRCLHRNVTRDTSAKLTLLAFTWTLYERKRFLELRLKPFRVPCVPLKEVARTLSVWSIRREMLYLV